MRGRAWEFENLLTRVATRLASEAMTRANKSPGKLIESAWRIHEWNPRWVPGKAKAALKYAALRLLTSRTKGHAIRVKLDGGQTMLVDPVDFVECHIGRFGSWEGPLFTAVRSLVDEGDVVFDVGGHVGYSTVLFADWVGERGHVWCFEPFEAHRDRIEGNLQANQFQDRVDVIGAAVSTTTGTAAFNAPGRLNTGVGALRKDADGRSIRVDTISIDELLAREAIDSVALCKVDIEGAEGAALRGMSNALRIQSIRAFLFEFHPSAMAQFGDTVESIVAMLGENGFSVRFWNGSAFKGDVTSGSGTYAIALSVKLLEQHA